VNDISRRGAVKFHERGVPNRYTHRHARSGPVAGWHLLSDWNGYLYAQESMRECIATPGRWPSDGQCVISTHQCRFKLLS